MGHAKYGLPQNPCKITKNYAHDIKIYGKRCYAESTGFAGSKVFKISKVFKVNAECLESFNLITFNLSPSTFQPSP